jgi:predicted dithiol-disulfide oxidoreductase (DUF899 family)
MLDRLRAERRALPWVKVDKTYVFETSDGPKTLAELFEGPSQLLRSESRTELPRRSLIRFG